MFRILFIAITVFLISASSPNDAREANEAYYNGDYEKAVELYKQAIEANPDNARLYFNLGNALAKLDHGDEAIRYFEQFKARTEHPGQRALADYNIGNIYAGNKKWDQAVHYYKEALRLRDSDIDAKHNYELAKRKKQEQEKQQQKKQQQDSQNQQDQQNQQQDQQPQDRKQQRQNNSQNQQQNKNQQQRNQQRQQQAPNRISKAEAEKILEALEQEEKELLKQFRKQKTESGNSTNGKDW